MTPEALTLNVKLSKKMEITLEAEKGELVIKKYVVNYPFIVHSHHKNANKILRKTSALKCKNIQGNFRLYYSRKLDFTHFANEVNKNKISGGTLTSSDSTILATDGTIDKTNVANRKQVILFEKKQFLYVNERQPESYLNDKKDLLPMWLVKKIDDVKKVVNFSLEYEKTELKLIDEKISIYLLLEYE